MKIKNIPFAACLLVAVAFNSCSGDQGASDLANEVCDCLMDAGLAEVKNNPYEIEHFLERKFERNIDISRVIAIGDKLHDKLKDLNRKERAAFIKNLLKTGLDSECTDILLSSIPWDEMERGRNRFRFGGEKKEEKKEDYKREEYTETEAEAVEESADYYGEEPYDPPIDPYEEYEEEYEEEYPEN